MLVEVIRCFSQQGRVTRRMAKKHIAVMTENRTHPACNVVVVDVRLAHFGRRIKRHATKRAAVALLR